MRSPGKQAVIKGRENKEQSDNNTEKGKSPCLGAWKSPRWRGFQEGRC